jgi:hypothetical protein
VPKAIVETGTPAARAASMACVSGRPTVLKPSDSSTIRAGGSSSVLVSIVDWKFSIAESELKMASPMAVASARSRLSIAFATCRSSR